VRLVVRPPTNGGSRTGVAAASTSGPRCALQCASSPN